MKAVWYAQNGGADALRAGEMPDPEVGPGHAGARSGGGHFRALIVSERFEGANAVARQRLVYAALSQEMDGDIHALSMRTLTPSEWDG